jgi:hypothetical protein
MGGCGTAIEYGDIVPSVLAYTAAHRRHIFLHTVGGIYVSSDFETLQLPGTHNV